MIKNIKVAVTEIPAEVSAVKSAVCYRQIWCFLKDKGNELYGGRFRLLHEDAPNILKLASWFAKDEALANTLCMDLSKGILLTGPVGCGKTSLMNLCRFLLPAEKRHRIKSCRDVSFEFAGEGHDMFYRYTRGSFSEYKSEPKTYCFDDLGLESKVSFYGNHCSVIAEILLSRYDLFQSFGMITHVTTNLNSSEIEERYGLRIRSRMREMFNLVAFAGDAADKRV